MCNSTTFGYEHEDGKIHYIRTHYMSLDEIQSYLILRSTPTHSNKTNISHSISEYFNENSFNDDNSSLRILYMLDGTIKCRRWGYKGEFIFRLI